MTPGELRARRHALGLSYEQLAQLLGTTGSTVYRWEAGKLGMRRPEMVAARLRELEAARV